jgi:hypothetical protein
MDSSFYILADLFVWLPKGLREFLGDSLGAKLITCLVTFN